MSTTVPFYVNSPNTLLVLDWDGTVSASDTLSVIAPSPEALEPYTKAYMDDMKTASDEFGPRDSLPRMEQWLEGMKEIEYTSVKRVEDGGLFTGMTRESLISRARDTSLITLQQGASELLDDFKGTWGMVSVGWSGLSIREALESRGVNLSNGVKVSANEVEFNGEGRGTGKLSKHKENERGIRVASDKLREMKVMVDEWRGRSGADGKADRVIYVGDSETDLLCLLEADLGVIMNSPGMVEKCHKMGVEVSEGLENVGASKTLRSVDDFRALLKA